MNARRIWKLWHEPCNTNEIARRLEVKEYDVERVIWGKMNEQFIRRKTRRGQVSSTICNVLRDAP